MEEWKDTQTFEKIFASQKRITIVQGGTSAGKTVAIVGMLADMSFDIESKIISICTDSYPNLKRGAIRDFKKFLTVQRWGRYFLENKTDHTFTNIITETVIEFFSVEEMGALGARRDYLFINEANRISEETFNQLEVRTKERVWLDFNPVNEFWAHDLLRKRPNDCEFLKLTYKDNTALPESIVKSIEARRGDGTSNWWRVYGLGEIGSLEGNVYEGWLSEEQLEKTASLKRYGVDFGFSNDPTAVIGVYEQEDGSVWLKQEILENRLLTPALIAKCKALPGADSTLFVCDSARPEIIAEMQTNGLRAIGADKTPGEKMNGKRYNIELVQRRKVHYLSQDKELEREYLSYAWRKKKTGEILDEPEDGNDHCMDAIAYAIRDMARKPIEYGGIIV